MRIHAARGQQGQIDVARLFRHLLTDTSAIAESHHHCHKVQGRIPFAASRR
ncbi:hypothetical protein JS561_21550 [Salmonella enterica subsp. enterica serovar Infantis]|nr:hypothetical protein JS561_21550 [Salmonella enterica subsp. enterica serovar Infantis]